MIEQRSLTLRGAAAGALRTTSFRGREHVVVPVVALLEGVVHAVNAENPEFVPAEEIAKSTAGWNGEPAMLDHPDVGGMKVSANSPDVLEKWQLGQVFNARMDGSRLKMDAYVDPARVETVGEQAQELLSTLEAGGVVEVSVGVFVNVEKREGRYNGKRFTGVWHDILPDHLALLPKGKEGACSVAAGCGAGVPRAATVHLVTAEGISIEEEAPLPADEKPEGKPLRQWVRDRIKSLTRALGGDAVTAAASVPEGESDMELRRALHDALRSAEPAFLGIDAVFPADSLVVYAVNPDDVMTLFSRGYTMENGTVTLAADRTEVEPVLKYQPVTAAEAASTPCGCQKKQDEQQPSALSAKEPSVHKNAERITALIANPKTPWTEHDRAHLEAQSDERLATLESGANAVEPPAPKKELTLADLPEKWRKAIEAQDALDAQEKNDAIAALQAADPALTAAELDVLPVATLKKMAALAAPAAPVASFAGRAAAARTTRTAEDRVPPAPDFNAAIKTAAAARR